MKILRLLSLGIVILFLIVSLTGIVSGASIQNQQIPEETYFYFDGATEKGNTLNYDITVVQGGNVDVYIVTESEYQKYKSKKNFNTEVSHQNIWSADGEYEIPDDEKYYVIIDNLDNAKSDDATPTGDVYVDMDVEVSEGGSEALLFICCGGAIALIALVGAAVYFKFYKKEKQSLALPSTRPYAQLPFPPPVRSSTHPIPPSPVTPVSEAVAVPAPMPPIPAVEFPVIDQCPSCGARLRAKKPERIRCPHCKSVARVDVYGHFLPEGGEEEKEENWDDLEV